MKAVILAGGRGERLKPLTNAIPKALACVGGKPIIQRQIELLMKLGVNEFIVLAGYRSQMLVHYLLSVNDLRLNSIEIIETPVDFSPAQRIISAKEKIGSDFLLIYCDNLITDETALTRIIDSRKDITFLAEKREAGNLSVYPNVRYYLNRSTSSPYVELGFLHLKSRKFFEVLESAISLEVALATLSSDVECGYELCENALISVSNIERFNKLRTRRKTILIDRDGILNKKMPHRKYLNNFDDYLPLQENINSLRNSYAETTDFIIITNQPGVATGDVDAEFLDKLHSRMITEMLILGISVIGVYVCIHHWDDNCVCRKPKPGMILRAISDFELEARKIVYIGDEDKDMAAAANANIVGIRLTNNPAPGEFHSLVDAFESIQAVISI